MCANDVLSHRALGKHSGSGTSFSQRLPALKSRDILFMPMFVTVGLIITGGVAALNLFQRLFDLFVSPTPVASRLSIAQAADLHPDCCGGVRPVAEEVFPGM